MTAEHSGVDDYMHFTAKSLVSDRDRDTTSKHLATPEHCTTELLVSDRGRGGSETAAKDTFGFGTETFLQDIAIINQQLHHATTYT